MRREGSSRAGVPFRRFTRRQALGAMTGLLGGKALERNYFKSSALCPAGPSDWSRASSRMQLVGSLRGEAAVGVGVGRARKFYIVCFSLAWPAYQSGNHGLARTTNESKVLHSSFLGDQNLRTVGCDLQRDVSGEHWRRLPFWSFSGCISTLPFLLSLLRKVHKVATEMLWV